MDRGVYTYKKEYVFTMYRGAIGVGSNMHGLKWIEIINESKPNSI